MRRVGWMAPAVVATLVAVAAPARADQPPMTASGCEEHEAWVDGDAAAVAAVLPRRYTAFTDANGAPLIFARAMRCAAASEGGRTEPGVMADWGVVINSPDGVGCASGTPQIGPVFGQAPPICNWYVLGLVTDDRDVVDWMRERTPAFPAEYVPDLVYRLGQADATGDTPFHFAAPTFTIDDVSSFGPGGLSLRGNYYFETPEGTIKIGASTDDLTPGNADSTLHAAPGSELARLMGATERTTPPAYASFGAIRIGHGVERKQFLGPARAGEALDSFAGSCSVQGDVDFNPPATNNRAPTVYAYHAKGTCTGTLNGTKLSGAPVGLSQSGHSDASCPQAMTFPPGDGTLTFPGGVQLPYTLDFTSLGTEVYGTLYGTRSGSAPLHATFATQRTSPDVTAQCGGDGAAKVPMDMTFNTRDALVDGRGTSGGTGAAAPARPRLRLSVSPHHARSRRATRFAFRVFPAGAATVWFAGRRMRTGPDGRATLTQRLVGRAGTRHVRATRRGFQAATGTILVRR